MYYKGKNIGLQEWVEIQKSDYVGKPEWVWEDEGIIYAMLDYTSSCDLTDSDIEWLKSADYYDTLMRLLELND